MNPKNLPLKFALFVALPVVACVWSIYGNGLKQGIDLRGGHSLIYELASPDATGAQVDETIKTLKQRVDPYGLLTLEWRPMGRNRFEVRMPAARPESLKARDVFLKSMEDLRAGNISRRQVVSLLELKEPQRSEAIEQATQDPVQRQRLADLAKANDALLAARAKQAASPDDEQLKQQVFEAANAYDNATDALDQTNVNVGRLQGILNNYLSESEAENLKKTNRQEAARRQEEYRKSLQEFIAKYPVREAAIKKVVADYERWAENRQRLDDPSDLERLIAKAGVLEFRIAPFNPRTAGQSPARVEQAVVNQYIQSLVESGPDALAKRKEPFVWKPISSQERASEYGNMITAEYEGRVYVLLYNQPDWMLLRGEGGGWELKDAVSDQDNTGRPAVGFEMDARGAKLFAALTSGHLQQHMAILLDDEVYSAPVIQSMISDRGQITGRFTREQVQELVQVLKAGSLPARLNPVPVAINSFGPSLGEENLRLGLRAGIWGFIATAGFMLVYYLLGGAIANVALVLNIILMLGAMSFLNAVFTMPGIAGVILSIGMAVDANVLIFERLREEQAKGLGIRMALKNAYERAFSAIFDSNVTTLITCGILGWVGTEEVKGFAITLGLGVLFNLFTAVVVTRWVFQALLQMNLLKGHIRMLRLIGVPKVDWMSKRYYFWAFSLATLALGIAALAWQGKDVLGIEFSAGTQATISFEDDALIDGKVPNDKLVRDAFIEKAGADGFARLRDTARVEKVIDRDRAGTLLSVYDENGDKTISLKEWTDKGRDGAYFKLFDKNGDGKWSVDELAALPAKSYQISTTETDLKKIRQVATQAFGDALETQGRVRYHLCADEMAPDLGIRTAADGKTLIDSQLIQRAASHRAELQEYQGGVLMVVKDLDPALSRDKLVKRLRNIRLQPDYGGGQFNPSEVIPLTAAPAGHDACTSFAVLVKPEEGQTASESAWAAFASTELGALTNALDREESMVAVNFDAQIAGDVSQSAIMAVILSWVTIIVYLWVRFGSMQWGLAAVICLIHDSVLITGLVALSAWISKTFLGPMLGVEAFKIDLPMVAALLTLIGYSVNDTIVVFDRIRENRGKLASVNAGIINLSVNQTLSRTLLTSSSVLLVVAIMYVWGGPGIHALNYALFLGVMFGTYSSVAVAAPLLLGFKQALIKRTMPGEQLTVSGK